MLVMVHPFPLLVLFRKVVQGLGNLCKVSDKLPVEVAKPNKLMNHLHILGRLPVTDGIHLHMLHLKAIGQ